MTVGVQELHIVDDQVGAPTWARNIANVTAMMVMAICHERLEGRFISRLLNLSSSGASSWFGFAEDILHYAAQRSARCGIASISAMSVKAQQRDRKTRDWREAESASDLASCFLIGN